MKDILIILSVLLALCSGYLFARHRYEVRGLNRRIAELEDNIARSREDCEIRIALAKTQCPQPGPLSDMVQKLRELQKKSESESLADMTEKLELSLEQQVRIRSILEEFKQTAKRLQSQFRQEGKTPFDPEQLEIFRVAREAVLAEIKAALTEAQYQEFLNDDFDRKLGLRPPARP